MSTKSPILEVEGVSKKFCLNLRRSMFYGAVDLANGLIGRDADRGILRKGEFWALQNVGFKLQQGETLGIIGSNGSGKSTLLRLITGIYPPDKGTIRVRGKVGALIALGAGFHPHMTGRENVYTNGTILGMSKAEIDARYEEIADFSELGQFMNSPVSTYSSGMVARLGFSIAVNSRPDLLIVDEVLAVGDLAFAIKCHRKMSDYRQSGGTTIMVSHSNQIIRNVCKNAIWLNKGIIEAIGDAQDVCALYEAESMRSIKASDDRNQSVMNYDSKARVSKVEILDKNSLPRSEFVFDEEMKIRIHIDCARKVRNPIFTISIHNIENIQVISNYTSFDGWKVDELEGKAYIDFILSPLTLNPSKYFLSLTFTENDINKPLEWHEKAYSFSVTKAPTSYGIFNPKPRWEFRRES
ncbi:MAG: ABC transporter ATP-binding protein [Oligoflexia bacterium]|nr:ABC transporter ATP-binding protein [Oligoflexia bacterium]